MNEFTKPGTHHVRVREVLQIWSLLSSLTELPQVDKWLSEQFKNKSKFGSRDRRWYSEVLFSMVRFAPLVVRLTQGKSSSEVIFRDCAKSCDAELFLYWTLVRLVDTDLNSEFQGAIDLLAHKLGRPHQKDLSSLKSLSHDPVYYGFPDQLIGELEKRCVRSHWDHFKRTKFVESQGHRPPLWLRLNFADKKSEVEKELVSLGFSVEPIDLTSGRGPAIKVVGAKGIYATESYRNGWVEIQDLASQLIGHAVGNRPGEFIWDACAGGGGKTMQLASESNNRGVIYASDLRAYKLEEVKKRARRAGFFNVRCLPWNGIEDLPFSKEVTLRGGFDCILVDAPCSSSGTWRRNPDAKYRIDKSNIEDLTNLQLQILTSAARSLRKNGRIVYSTCSWFEAENELVVERFLKNHLNFQVASMEMVGLPTHDADTMFVAVIEKVTI